MTLATKNLIAAVAVALLGGTAAWAQDPPATPTPAPGDSVRSVAPGEAVPLPDVQTSGAASYVTGGIPYEQIPAFTRARSQYPLNVEIYQKAGAKNEFTADVGVKLISVKSGDVVLDARTQGPYLWAKVPAGQYRMQATMNGKMMESRVAVNNAHSTRAIVVFPAGTDQ